jgi:hypothetical protein
MTPIRASKLRDVGPGILERDQLAAVRQRDRIVEEAFSALPGYSHPVGWSSNLVCRRF